MTYQLKLLTTAAFSVLFLHKRISVVQWISQIILFVGVGIVQLQDHMEPSISTPHNASSTAGLGGVLFASLLSGFAAVYFEKVKYLTE